jgi:pimeloyl-ACP methyl ester carboxylesterase
MPAIEVNGGKVAYEILGEGDPIVLTPGGRFSMGIPGLRPLAEALAPHMKVLIWDRPNAGASDLNFTGETESDMHADTLAELLRRLDMAPAVIAGGSAGARVSLITALRHPDVTRKILGWWLSGGVYGTMILAMTYNLPFMATALTGGMTGVADMPQWAETIAANPGNRQRLLDMDVEEFLAVMDRWLRAFVPEEGKPIPGVTSEQFASIDVPTVIWRSSPLDRYHTEETSLRVHSLIPGAKLVEPPWGDDEWTRLQILTSQGKGHIFDTWPRLAPQILEYSKEG